jgi:uncharacterized protein (DUF433 family)
MENFRDYIEINREKRFGQPCIKGTRITVYDILSMLASGMDNQQIMEEFPELNTNHIKAALLFAADKEHSLRIAS